MRHKIHRNWTVYIEFQIEATIRRNSSKICMLWWNHNFFFYCRTVVVFFFSFGWLTLTKQWKFKKKKKSKSILVKTWFFFVCLSLPFFFLYQQYCVEKNVKQRQVVFWHDFLKNFMPFAFARISNWTTVDFNNDNQMSDRYFAIDAICFFYEYCLTNAWSNSLDN